MVLYSHYYQLDNITALLGEIGCSSPGNLTSVRNSLFDLNILTHLLFLITIYTFLSTIILT